MSFPYWTVVKVNYSNTSRFSCQEGGGGWGMMASSHFLNKCDFKRFKCCLRMPDWESPSTTMHTGLDKVSVYLASQETAYEMVANGFHI